MSQAWYVKHKNKTYGPFTPGKLKQLATSAKIAKSTELRLGKDGKWILATRVKGLFSSAVLKAAVASKPLPSSKPVTKKKASLAPWHSPDSESPTVPRATAPANPYQSPKIYPSDKIGAKERTGGPHKLSEAFRTIWFQPRVTIRWLIDARSPREAILLISIVFSLKYLDNVVSSGGQFASGLLLAPITIPISALIGIFFLYAAGLFYRLIGRRLGGEGDGPDLRTAFAWSFVPTIVAFPLTVLLFTALTFWPSMTLSTPQWVINLPFFALSLWGIVLQIAGISVAHRFSIPRAIGTFLLAIVLNILVITTVVVAGLMIVWISANAYS